MKLSGLSFYLLEVEKIILFNNLNKARHIERDVQNYLMYIGALYGWIISNKIKYIEDDSLKDRKW